MKKNRSFWRGFSSILDIGGSGTYRASKKRKSTKAGIESDWNSVGRDLRKVMK